MKAPELMNTQFAAQVHEPVLRGHQYVAALWFPARWFDESARAARLIASWRAGASALRFPEGDLLCFSAPFEEHCEGLAGWSLRQDGGALCSAPLSDAERSRLRDGDVWIVLGAEVLTLSKRDGEPLDPSAWLAAGEGSLHETYDLSVPPPPPEVLDFESRPLREVLGDAVPPASRERGDFLDAMRRAQRENPKGLPSSGGGSSGGHGLGWALSGIAFIVVVFVLVAVVIYLASKTPRLSFFWLILLFLGVRAAIAALKAREAAARGGPAAQPVRVVPPRGGLAHPQRWRRWLAQFAMVTQLSRLLGRAHAKHLKRVLDMFDEGNLQEALRHAIPLGGNEGSLGQSFGLPGRRDRLELSRHNGPGTSISIGDEIEQHLRALYRKAFEKLDREQRFDEAVFVLAELLNAKQEALDYLEKHERFAQAAELALGWNMPPEVIVRLHCLAGDWRRAVVVARRDNAFAAAVVQMQKRWPDAARRLREEWGGALIARGDWLGAVDAVWPVESLRDKAKEWLLTAEAAGGRLGMRALVQRAVLLPDTLERYSKELLELQRDPALWRERVAMADALGGIERRNATQQLAALIAPALLADHAEGHRRMDRHSLEQFVKHSGDVLLQADLPTRDWPDAGSQPASKNTEALELEAPAPGALEIEDVVPLDDQRYLVALGESGACVVDASGKIRSRFAAPARWIVLAHSKQVALLLARREALWRVSRLDLAQNTVTDLGMLDFDFWAREFDGLNWTVAKGRALRVIDTQDSLRQVVWQVTDLPGVVSAFVASATHEQFMLEVEDKPPQLWVYRLPQRQLITRDDVSYDEGELKYLNPAGGVVRLWLEQSEELISLKWQAAGRAAHLLVPGTLDSLRVWPVGEWLVVFTGDDGEWDVRWILLSSGAECVRVTWPGDAAPLVRVVGDEWLIYDARGRLLNFNVATSSRQTLSVR
jgi:hypothetical protein